MQFQNNRLNEYEIFMRFTSTNFRGQKHNNIISLELKNNFKVKRGIEHSHHHHHKTKITRFRLIGCRYFQSEHGHPPWVAHNNHKTSWNLSYPPLFPSSSLWLVLVCVDPCGINSLHHPIPLYHHNKHWTQSGLLPTLPLRQRDDDDDDDGCRFRQ
jgi:hypothetical protein